MSETKSLGAEGLERLGSTHWVDLGKSSFQAPLFYVENEHNNDKERPLRQVHCGKHNMCVSYCCVVERTQGEHQRRGPHC